MSLLDAHHLLAKVFGVGAVCVRAEGREVVAVVDGIDNAQGIYRRKDVVQPRRSKIIANDLKRIVEGLRNSSEIGGAGAWRGPRIDQGRDFYECDSRRRADGDGCN